MSLIKSFKAWKKALFKGAVLISFSFSAPAVLAENTSAAEIKVVTEYLEPNKKKNADGSLGGY